MTQYLIYLALIAVTTVLCRMAGGGLGAHILNEKGYQGGKAPFNMTFLPELILAGLIGQYAGAHVPAITFESMGYQVTLAKGLIGTIIAYLGIQTGHAVAYTMGRNPDIAKMQTNTLCKIVNPIANLFKLERGGRAFSWIFMGLKGAIIGLAVAPAGLLLAVLWPLAYDIGRILRERGYVTSGTKVGEYLSGAFIGVVLCLIL